MGKFIGPGYVRLGPVTAGAFGIGCLMQTVIAFMVATITGLAYLSRGNR